jgi:hypothetical protein
MKIRFFFDGYPSAKCIANLRKMYGAEASADLLTDLDDYTHAIIINCTMPTNLKVPKECVIGFAHEPLPFLQISQQFINFAKQHISKYYISDATGLPPPFIGGFAYMWHSPAPTTNLKKTKFCSIMVSQKTFAAGHRYRHELVKAILKTDLPIDVFGRGCQFYWADPRLKGAFNDEVPMVADYMYHIAIENFREPHYISEKVINPLLYECIPIYLGCPNIDDYFPATTSTTLKLSGNVTRDIEMLKWLYTHPKVREPAPSETVYNRVNLLRHLDELF